MRGRVRQAEIADRPPQPPRFTLDLSPHAGRGKALSTNFLWIALGFIAQGMCAGGGMQGQMGNGLLLVGSVPLDSVEEVMRTFGPTWNTSRRRCRMAKSASAASG